MQGFNLSMAAGRKVTFGTALEPANVMQIQQEKAAH
jgi:hypothetical protein